MDLEEGSSTSIASLAPQVLAHILRCLPAKERLHSCALVCHTWHAAATAATNSIGGDTMCPQDKLTGLSGWLQVYAGPAAVSSLRLIGWRLKLPQVYSFTLPSQQLDALRSLTLKNLEVTGTADSDGQHHQRQEQDEEQQEPLRFLTPIMTPELSALTKLSLQDCRLNLNGLRSLKHLCSLSLKYSKGYRIAGAGGFPLQHSRNIVELTAALRVQVQLTSLVLVGGFCRPAVAAACSSLPALQRLKLHGTLTNQALADLPLSLTQLEVVCRQGTSGTAGLTLTAEAAPWLRQLTALQELSLHDVDVFHPVLLQRMLDLRTLFLSCNAIDKGYAEPGLDVLTRLTKLQSLFLRADALAAGAAAPADIAALTSSSQLTSIDVVGLADAQLRLMFPAEQQLPKLDEASFDAALLLQEHHDTLARAVQCCPGLTSMQLRLGDTGEEDPDALNAALFEHGLQLLSGFPCLQRLNFLNVPVSYAGWRALAALPSLRDLTVDDSRVGTLSGVVAMTACRSLTRLVVETYVADLRVENQAPAGSPPDTWSRLPAAVIETAWDLVPDLQHDEGLFDIYHHLTLSAAAAMGIVQAEQQQEVAGLRQRTAALEAAQAEQQQQMREMQQQNGVLQQQVQDMQTAMQHLLQGLRQ